MTNQKTASRIRFVYKRSSRLTKIAVCAAAALSAVALLYLHSATLDARAEAEELRKQAQQAQQQNTELENKIDILGSAESAEQIARDELGMVDPDTIIIQPEN